MGAIGTDRAEAEAGCYCGTRATARPSGDSVEVPRISCRAVEWVDRGSAEGPFVQIGFAQNNGSCFLQPGDDSSVEVGNPLVEHLRSRSGPNPMGRNVVFNGEWNTVERAAIVTLRNLILCSLRLGHGVFRRNRDVSVEHRIESHDAG